MKLENIKKWNNIRRHSRGYAAMAMVALLGVTALLGIMSVFRQSMRSHEAQVRNQVKIDYGQREDALLRALVAIVPNKAVGAMQQGSAGLTAAGNNTELSWDRVFVEAIEAAKADEAVSAVTLNGLGISGHVIANTGDNSALLPASFVSKIAGTGVLAGEGITANGGLLGSSVAGKLPPALVYTGGSAAGLSTPIISAFRNYAIPDVALFPNYNVIPYPDIRFGFVNQAGSFIAKHNWWAFSMTFGTGTMITNNTGTASSAIPTVTKNYVLSIYEVPAQLAVSAGAKLKLEGGAWAAANIEGSIFASEVDASGLTTTGANATITARRTVNLGGGATVGGQNVADGFNTLGAREARWANSGSDMYAASNAGSSGRVAILPLSQGDAFIRRTTNPIGNTLGDTTWDTYALGSRKCAMGIEILEMEALGDNKPVAVRFHYIATTGLPTSVVFEPESTDPNAPWDSSLSWQNHSIGAGIATWENYNRDRFMWDHDNDDPDGDGRNAAGNPDSAPVPSVIPFYWENLKNGAAPVLTVKLDRFPNFLSLLGQGGRPGLPALGADIHNSLAIWENTADATITAPSIPSQVDEMGVVIRDAENIATVLIEGYPARPGFTKGFSLVTDHRVYMVGEINQQPLAPPVGAVLPPGVQYFPPVSIFAAEKRFGTADTSNGNVIIDGQLTSLQEDDGTVVDPLALQLGTGNIAVGAGVINANLTQITSPAQLPPVNKMTWLVVVEEITQ